jgi:hypothetical protein
MSLRILRFGTIICANSDFCTAEFTDFTCRVLTVKVRNPDYNEEKSNDPKIPKYLIKHTPTNPKYACDIMEYVQDYVDDPCCNSAWDSNWTLPQLK